MTEKLYGIHAVEGVLRHEPLRIQQLWLQAGRQDKRMLALVALAENQGVQIERVPRKQLDQWVSGRHQGVVAAVSASTKAPTLDEHSLGAIVEGAANPLVLVLDGVTDPHNLGACLRSADAAGVSAVVVPKDKSADLTPIVRKVACGGAEAVPFVRVTNLARTLETLKAAGLWVVGTAGEAEQMVYDRDLKGPIALVMGAEGGGMRRLTREACDFLVKLPMAGAVSSLNVSVATGICLFEAVRQRRGAA